MTDENIKLFKAEEQELEFTIEDSDGEVIDLTDGSIETVKFLVATNLEDYGEQKFDLDGTNFSENGEVTFRISPEDTENLTAGNYLYSVWIEYGNEENYVAEVGKFFVKPRVDR